MCLPGASAFIIYNCHSDDRREEESEYTNVNHNVYAFRFFASL